jgi:hypothetical protein
VSCTCVGGRLEVPSPEGAVCGQILLNTIPPRGGGACTTRAFEGEEGTAGLAVGGGCWSWWRPAGKQCQERRTLAVDQLVLVDPSRGVRQDMAKAGGRSQTEERLCEATTILMISRRRKAMYEGLFRKLN